MELLPFPECSDDAHRMLLSFCLKDLGSEEYGYFTEHFIRCHLLQIEKRLVEDALDVLRDLQVDPERFREALSYELDFLADQICPITPLKKRGKLLAMPQCDSAQHEVIAQYCLGTLSVLEVPAFLEHMKICKRLRAVVGLIEAELAFSQASHILTDHLVARLCYEHRTQKKVG